MASACIVAFSLLSGCEQKINQTVNPHIQLGITMPQSEQLSADNAAPAPPSTQPSSQPSLKPIPEISRVPNPPPASPEISIIPSPIVASPAATPTPRPTVAPTPAPAFFSTWSQPIKANLSASCDLTCKPIYQSVFVDFKTGWAIDDRNQLSHTQDAGATWQVQSLGTNRVNSLSFVDQNTGWIAGDKGMIRKTSDGGKTWQVQDSGVSDWINKIAFFNTKSGVFITRDKAFRSQDGGESWHQIADANHTWEIYAISPDKTLFFSRGTYARPVLLDGGLTFPVQVYEPQDTINGVSFQDENTGYIYGSVLLKTTDGGQSWQKQERLLTNEEILQPEKDWIYGMAFANAQEGILMVKGYDVWADGNVLYYTSDGGETWTKTTVKIPVKDFAAIRELKLFGGLNQGWAFASGSDTGYLYRLGRP